MRAATRVSLILTSLSLCAFAFLPVKVSAQVLDHAPVPFTGERAVRGAVEEPGAERHSHRPARTPAQESPDARERHPGPPTVRTARNRGPRLFSRPQRGRAAITALGSRLDRVAARNRLAPDDLRAILREDPKAWLAAHGDLYYSEDQPEEVVGGAEQAAPPPAYPTERTFSLHSRPGAARTIFLDFDGATVENTAWNGTGPGQIANGTHIGWDSDGTPSTFSTTEHGWIQEVWRQVAETYAPFDVDVTTQDMGADSWTRASTSDLSYGSHVLVTSSAGAKSQACGGCLGVAWVGSFRFVDPQADYQPAWVFADNPRFDPMIVAQAASHEAGHNLGLHHDATATSSYYAGTSAWGPIMGSARTRAVSQFSRGEYAGASNTQDDLAVMQSYGLPLRTDDHGSSLGAATQLGRRTAYDVSGVVATRTDTDVFALTLDCATDLVVSATGIGPQSTLDLSLELLGPDGGRLAFSSPASTWTGSPPASGGMDAQVSLPGASGTYLVRVDGVGNGDPAGTGWSDYGSLGQYRLTATGCTDAPEGPGPGTAVTAVPAGDGPTQAPPTSGPPPSSPPAATRPSAPRITTASSGSRGGRVTAVARWAAPSSTGGSPVTKYRVRAQRRDSADRVVDVTYSAFQRPGSRSVSMTLRKGRYSFTVMAWNSAGASAWSRPSNRVLAR